ncbi:MAG: electron transfer flavoprotein subunit beta/FixA family protein [Planctomycetes bacterium]|nr:electron transfer flavoprotein subunit beta/FixA family protein [Planctomycetota bacterium]NUQ34898.1 electron transfer flavoprotein subunit beta/FixA family protein [Planctomycetaceae bacterium]
MKIVVLVKRVPDTETKVKVAGKSLDPAGVNYILNPYDEFAIEEAILLKEKHGGETIVMSVGNKDCTKEIRTALAMGVDAGVLLEAETNFCDAWSLAGAIAKKLADMKPDLVLLGKQAVDDDNTALGQYLAEKLGLPCVTVAVALEINGTKATAERQIEGGREKVEFSLPAVVTCQKGLNTPRYASMKGIMMAKKKTVEEVAVKLDAPKTRIASMELPPPRPEGRIVGEGPDAVPALITALRSEAKVI